MQNIVGIVAEYNPFHNGHAFHVEETRARLGEACGVVAVMSGDFVQRGESAIYSKFARAEAAVKCGCDLVLELPLPWSVASAEGFARGAVGLLGALGVVTYLSFGSESGSLPDLHTLTLQLMDPTFSEDLKAELQHGLSFAAARQRAMEKRVGAQAKLLETPNNILAVEYLKALYTLRIPIRPITVQRKGAQHDGHGGDTILSASELRTRIEDGQDVSAWLPEAAAEIFRREAELGRGPITPAMLETAILSRLRMLGPDVYAALPGAEEGLGNALCRAANEEPTLDGVITAAKSKRYALSRIRRMAMCAALGVKKGMADGTPPYIRVLAANERGREILRLAGEKASVPIITKPAAGRGASPEIERLMALTAESHDLYVLGSPVAEERRAGNDWRHSPIMI
ncbi:MAG: nucleotidyltransferase family protein [Oscillospiraceae bacterium]|nr:nucleotidyltransferase family protein [Oscillospiraceae bacterium]